MRSDRARRDRVGDVDVEAEDASRDFAGAHVGEVRDEVAAARQSARIGRDGLTDDRLGPTNLHAEQVMIRCHLADGREGMLAGEHEHLRTLER